MTKEVLIRDSNMELLRIVSIFAIIFYHILLFVNRELCDAPIYQALFMPLHVGVLLFVMISGYFHINFSIKKLILIIVPLLVYSLPSIVSALLNRNLCGMELVYNFLFVSHSQYWYMRIYIGLFLLAPVINKFLNTCSNNGRVALIASLLFIATWGGVTHSDPSLYDGKNIINFILLYVIGDTLRKKNYRIQQIPIRLLLALYVLLNLFLVCCYVLFHDSSIAQVVYLLSYPYCSPILLLNAILVFIIFMKYSFKSMIINYMAKSVLAIYLIHCNNFIFPTIVKPMIVKLFYDGNVFLSLSTLGLLAIFILIICLIIDKILTPVWSFASKLAEKINVKFSIVYN